MIIKQEERVKAILSFQHAPFWFKDLSNLRHFTGFIRLLPANLAVAKLIFKHGIISGAGTSKFLTGEDVSNIDQGKRYAEYAEYNG